MKQQTTSPNEPILEVSALFHSVERCHSVRLICFIWWCFILCNYELILKGSSYFHSTRQVPLVSQVGLQMLSAPNRIVSDSASAWLWRLQVDSLTGVPLRSHVCDHCFHSYGTCGRVVWMQRLFSCDPGSNPLERFQRLNHILNADDLSFHLVYGSPGTLFFGTSTYLVSGPYPLCSS